MHGASMAAWQLQLSWLVAYLHNNNGQPGVHAGLRDRTTREGRRHRRVVG
jgi:hypothetical protein